MLRGDLGESISTGESVLPLILDRFAVSGPIVLVAVLIAILIAVPAGVLAAWRHNSALDMLAVVAATAIAISMPSFWLGLLLLLLFGLKLGWLPVVGYVSMSEDLVASLAYLVLPIATLALIEAGALTRMMRATTLEVLGLDYVTHARAKGLPESRVLFRHVLLAVSAGVAIGLVAGYLRGWLDRILMICNDALLAFPGVLLALGLMVVVGGSRSGIVLALGIAYTPPVVRVVRGTVLSLREKEFVEASRILGNSQAYTMLRHVLPNAVAPIAVLATSMFGWVLLSESALSFLGLGIAPPSPTWGNMLAASRPFLSQATWLSIVPGACIALTLIGVNLLGDALRDRLDPRMSQR